MSTEKTSRNARSGERPLVTFCVAGYNQERFIGEAVESALAQTYSPLEIILSDDCSTDRTFEIMREMAGRYGGPHRLILNRNPRNLGIGPHVNRCMELARGELVVGAAGDDRFLPDRTEKIVATWNAVGRPVCVIYSDFVQMTEDGRPLETLRRNPGEIISLQEALRGERSPIVGCTQSWHRALFEFFGPLREDVVNEDSVLWFRAELLGRVIHVPQVLMHRRLHDNNASNCGLSAALELGAWLRANTEAMRRQVTLFQNHLDDLARLRKAGRDRADLNGIEHKLTRWLKFSRARRELYVANGIGWWKPAGQCLLTAPSLYCLSQMPKVFAKLLWPRLYFRFRKK